MNHSFIFPDQKIADFARFIGMLAACMSLQGWNCKHSYIFLRKGLKEINDCIAYIYIYIYISRTRIYELHRFLINVSSVEN